MNKPEIIITADPGRTGAIAIINTDMEVLKLFDWPKVETFSYKNVTGKDGKKKKKKVTKIHHGKEIFELFKIFEGIGLIPSKQGVYKDIFCAIEKVWAFKSKPGKDGKEMGLGIDSTANLIGSYRTLVTFFIVATGKVPLLVPPQTWHKSILGKKPGDGMDTKKASLQTATALFPDAALKYLTRKMDHGRSDALNLAYYLLERMKEGG